MLGNEAKLLNARSLSYKTACNPVELHNCLSGNNNKCNPYAGVNNYHCLGFPSRSKHSACRPLGLPAPIFRSPGLRPSGSSSCRQDANRAVQGRMPFRVRFWLLLAPKVTPSGGLKIHNLTF